MASKLQASYATSQLGPVIDQLAMDSVLFIRNQDSGKSGSSAAVGDDFRQALIEHLITSHCKRYSYNIPDLASFSPEAIQLAKDEIKALEDLIEEEVKTVESVRGKKGGHHKH